GTFEPARVIVAIAQATSASARANTITPSQPAGTAGQNERQGHEPVEREPGKHRDRPRDRRPDNDIRGTRRISHGGAIEFFQTSWNFHVCCTDTVDLLNGYY